MRYVTRAFVAFAGLAALVSAQDVLPVEGAITFEEANRRAALPRWLSLKFGDFDTTGPAPAIPVDLQSRPGDGRDYFVVQMTGPISEQQKQALRERGMDVLDYVPNHAFIVRGTKAQVAASQAANEVVWSSPMHTAWRIDPLLLRQPTQGRLAILGFDGVLAATLVAQLEAAGATVNEQNLIDTRWLIVATVAPKDLVAVAKCRDVQWVEAESVVADRNNQMVWTVQSGSSGSTPIWDQGLHGEGQIIGHMDGAVNSSSCYFNDPSSSIGPSHRKIVYQSGSTNSNTHGTHTAGTAAGDAQPITGSTSNRGIAYKARLAHSSNYSASVWYSRSVTHYGVGARLHTNSWGNDGTTAYNSHCNAIDLFQWNYQDNLVFFAETNQSTLRNPENAKNLVAVGNGQNGSAANGKCGGGVGPTADGRQKPDLFTPGCSLVSANTSSCGTSSLTGTSMACPGATGAAALVRQYFLEGFYPTGAATPANSLTPTNALMKAVLINTSRDMTGVSGYPNSSEGWGRVVLDDSLYFLGDNDKLWVQDQRRAGGITTGQSLQFTLEVLSSARPLEVTLCFTDYAGTVNSSNPVINNLDLVVTAPNGATYRGNVFAGGWSIGGGAADSKNNVERVAIASPQTGTWTFAVSAPSVPVGPSGYALCATGDVDAGAGYASFSTFGEGCDGSTVIPAPPCQQWNPTAGPLTNQTSTDEWVFRVASTSPKEVAGFELYCASLGGGSVTVPARLYVGNSPGTAPIATTTMTIGSAPGFYTATFASPVSTSGAFHIGIDSSALNVFLPIVHLGNYNIAYTRSSASVPWSVQAVRPAYVVNCAPEYEVPELTNTGLPVLGSSFDVELASALPSTFAVLVQGLSDQSFPGGSLPVTLPGTPSCDILVSPDVYDSLVTDASGAADSTVSVPNSPVLVSFEIFYQWVVLDSVANPFGLVTSNGGKAKLGN
jgi:hypothetical protein